MENRYEKRRAYEFCDRIEKENLNLTLNCFFKVTEADTELFKRLKSVGLTWLTYGIESGNQTVLDKVDKNITIDQIKKAIRLAKEAGLKTECDFMIGNIGETEETLNDSLVLAREARGTLNLFQYAVPFPGTKFYEEYEKYGKIISKNFDEFNPRNVVFVPDGLTKEKMEEAFLKSREVFYYGD